MIRGFVDPWWGLHGSPDLAGFVRKGFFCGTWTPGIEVSSGSKGNG